MRLGRRVSRWAVTLVMAMFVAACTGASSSAPAQSTPPAPSASPSGPAAPAYRLRATTTQAVPPIDRFGLLPMVTITGDNQVVVAGPQIAIYPGPLLPNLQARPITDAGFAKIVERGRALGMFTGSGDFVPPDVMPGASLGRIEIVVDGVLHELTGDPSRVIVCVTTPCDPAPGTPEAFGAFWASLSDLTWLAGDLGQERHTSPIRTLCSSAWSRSTIPPSGPRGDLAARATHRDAGQAGRIRRRHPAAGRSAVRTPQHSDPAWRRRTS